LLYSDYIIPTGGSSQTYYLLKAGGDNVRVTGLRLRGPPTFVGSNDISTYAYSLYVGMLSYGYDFEVDNNEIYRQDYVGVKSSWGANGYVHHNYIHNNTRDGLGYGVVLDGPSYALIEANLFDFNRHSISGSGYPGQNYTASYNLVNENGIGQQFDMHGGADRGDGTDIAGDRIEMYGNTFYKVTNKRYVPPPGTKVGAIGIRGIPTDGAYIYNNYFFYDDYEDGIHQQNAFGNMFVYDNCYLGLTFNLSNGINTYSASVVSGGVTDTSQTRNLNINAPLP
ncbi:MAG: right-handed parallel beta-helix repeat-containing protein, partial [archaeon]|nr:right-handed parallel beta-helix repeat-containing protein [archaeon]